MPFSEEFNNHTVRKFYRAIYGQRVNYSGTVNYIRQGVLQSLIT